MTTVRAVVAVLRGIESFTLSAGILVLAAVTIANVLFRSLAGWSLAWAEEMSSFLVLWVTFLGVAEAARRNRHIRMTAITDALPAAARRRLEVVVALVSGTFFLVLAAIAADYVARVQSWGTVSPALRVPIFLVYAAAPLGLLAAAGEYAWIAYQGGVAEEEPLASREARW